MRTKTIPAIVMLIGGAVACILGITNQYETTHFLKMIFVVLIVFYILGCIVKIILDKNLVQMEEKDTGGEEQPEEEKENIESEDEIQNDE